MSRVKKGVSAKKHHKYTLARTKGYNYGRKSKFRLAKEALLNADKFSYRDRRNRKRDFRSLWIVRINNAARKLNMSYSQLISNLKGKTDLNRKMLAQLAVKDEAAFQDFVNQLVK